MIQTALVYSVKMVLLRFAIFYSYYIMFYCYNSKRRELFSHIISDPCLPGPLRSEWLTREKMTTSLETEPYISTYTL